MTRLQNLQELHLRCATLSHLGVPELLRAVRAIPRLCGLHLDMEHALDANGAVVLELLTGLADLPQLMMGLVHCARDGAVL